MGAIYEKVDVEGGVSATVLKMKDTGKFHAIFRDTDANMVVAVTICPTLELAIEKANDWIRS